MLSRLIQSTLLGSLLLSNLAFAQPCLEPEQVTLPDGATVKSDMMIQIHEAVNKYISDAGNFLLCLDEEEKNSPAPLTIEQKKTQVMRYNLVVEKMHQLARDFNEQLSIYKTTNSEKTAQQ
jgi:hypothetical protein